MRGYRQYKFRALLDFLSPPPPPPLFFFLRLILIENFMLIKNRIKTLVSKPKLNALICREKYKNIQQIPNIRHLV